METLPIFAPNITYTMDNNCMWKNWSHTDFRNFKSIDSLHLPKNIGWCILFGQFKLLPQSKLLLLNHQPCGRQTFMCLLEQLTFRLWDKDWKTHSVFNGLSICLLISNISSLRNKNLKCLVSNSAYFWNFAYSILINKVAAMKCMELETLARESKHAKK